MREPEKLLGRRVEAAILDHANPRVLDGHVAAAAFEAPIDERDREMLGDEALERGAARPRAQAHEARLGVGRARTYPAARVALRSAERRRVLRRRRDDRLGARHRRALARLLDRARGRGLPPSRRAVPRARARRRPRGTRSSSRSAATGTRRRRRRRRPTIEGPLRTERRLGLDAGLRARLGDGAGGRVPAEGDPRPGDDRARAARPAGRRRSRPRRSGSVPSPSSSTASRRCRSSSARSTPPSTR